MNPFLFVVIACVSSQPFCLATGDGIGLVLTSDPLPREECVAKLEIFAERMKRNPQLTGFYFGQCKKDGADV